MARPGRSAATLDDWLDWEQRLPSPKPNGTVPNGINLRRNLGRIRWLVSLACGVFATLWCKAVEPPVRMVGV